MLRTHHKEYFSELNGNSCFKKVQRLVIKILIIEYV